MNRETFFAAIRLAPFAGSLSQSQVDGVNAILAEWDKRGLTDVRWLAYMLATTFHETARTMQPIREHGRGRGMRYGTTYYGRGFVQLTWEENYRKAAAAVGVDLIADPDRALELPIAATIMFDGMTKGWFTGSKLADFIAGKTCDYVQARRIVNGTDKAVTIAGYAVNFQRALDAATITPANTPTHDQPLILPAEPKPPPKLVPRQPDDPGAEPPQPAPSGGFFDALITFINAVIAALTGKGT
jgi:putative chitinase